MIKGNSSNTEIAVEAKKYVGIGNFKVLGVNLDFEELTELGFMRTKEPVYDVEMRGVMMKKITFYVVNIDTGLKLPIDFFISDNDKTSSAGNYRIINHYGQSCYASSIEDAAKYDWFSMTGARIAKDGEVELTNFLINWLNVKNFVTKQEQAQGQVPDEAYIENWTALVDGDLKEIQQYVKEYKDNEIKCLVYIKAGYMNIYNGKFERATTKRLDNWVAHSNKQKADGYPLPGEYVIDLLQEFTPSLVADVEEPDMVYATTTDDDLLI